MALHYLLSSWGLCKGVYYTALTDRGPCPLRRGWCLDLLAWPTLKNVLLIRGTWWERTAGPFNTGCWAVWLQVSHPWVVFKTSLVLREAVARGPASLLSLSHTSSDIRFGYRNRALLAGALMTDCWLRNEYSVRLITQLEQAVMKWKTILFQLFFGSIFYRPACCLFLYIKRTLKL